MFYKPTFGQIAAGRYRNHPRYRGCIGHWLLGEGGGLVAFDISGNRDNGALQNGPTWAPGQFGTALAFDGTDDFIDIGDSVPVDTSLTKLSVSAWFKLDVLPTSGTTRATIAAKYNTAVNGREFQLMVGHNPTSDWDALAWNIQELGTSYNSATDMKGPTVVIDQWYHVVATYLGGTFMRIYLNGVLATEDTTDIPTDFTDTDAGLLIGADAVGTTNKLNGLIDDVRIYNRALSTTEIVSLYNDPFAEFRVAPRRVLVSVGAAAGPVLQSGSSPWPQRSQFAPLFAH